MVGGVASCGALHHPGVLVGVPVGMPIAAPSTPSPSPRPVTPDSSSPAVIHARTGEVLIRLPETPTSGYRWQPTAVPDGVTVVDSHFDASPATAPVAGASGHRVFRLEIPVAGTYDLQFAMKRTWESQPAEVRTVRLVVATP